MSLKIGWQNVFLCHELTFSRWQKQFVTKNKFSPIEQMTNWNRFFLFLWSFFCFTNWQNRQIRGLAAGGQMLGLILVSCWAVTIAICRQSRAEDWKRWARDGCYSRPPWPRLLQSALSYIGIAITVPTLIYYFNPSLTLHSQAPSRPRSTLVPTYIWFGD